MGDIIYLAKLFDPTLLMDLESIKCIEKINNEKNIEISEDELSI
ncbi:MAG: hypothetical protein ACRCX2_27705 [Paraclostridium sp.]